jgi:hypothetical protein
MDTLLTNSSLSGEEISEIIANARAAVGGQPSLADVVNPTVNPASQEVSTSSESSESNESGMESPATSESPADNSTPEIIPVLPGQASVGNDTARARFSSAVWFEKAGSFNIILAGLGGIGSWTALLLSRLKPRSLIMYDNDTVERVNLAGQLFSTEDILRPKVAAVQDLIYKYSDFCTSPRYSRYTSRGEVTKIMICGFDNMASRKQFYYKWVGYVTEELSEEQRKSCLFIDGRMAAEEFQVFCVQGNDKRAMNLYEKTLFDDSEAEPTTCSYKQTTFMASMIASVICNLYVNFCANLSEGVVFPRDVPYLTEYDASTMYFKTIA